MTVEGYCRHIGFEGSAGGNDECFDANGNPIIPDQETAPITGIKPLCVATSEDREGVVVYVEITFATP
jgi:hypothetical protein